MKVRPRHGQLEATQWNGATAFHPKVEPYHPGAGADTMLPRPCGRCGIPFAEHGMVREPTQPGVGRLVCPGAWIVERPSAWGGHIVEDVLDDQAFQGRFEPVGEAEEVA